MAKHTTKKVVKRNPTDSTMRNVRAAQKQLAHLLERVVALTLRVTELERRVGPM